MLQFWMSIKPNVCQRHLLKFKHAYPSFRRNLSVGNLIKSQSFSVKAKVAFGVTSLTGSIGYHYVFGFENIKNVIPVAQCESVLPLNNLGIKASEPYNEKSSENVPTHRYVKYIVRYIVQYTVEYIVKYIV